MRVPCNSWSVLCLPQNVCPQALYTRYPNILSSCNRPSARVCAREKVSCIQCSNATFSPNFVYYSERAYSLITLHSNFEISLKGHPAVDVMLDRRIFER